MEDLKSRNGYSETDFLQEVADSEYEYGFVTEIESENAPAGLSEDTIRFIWEKKQEPQWMLDWRLRALRHWESLHAKQAYPRWAHLTYPDVDFQKIIY